MPIEPYQSKDYRGDIVRNSWWLQIIDNLHATHLSGDT